VWVLGKNEPHWKNNIHKSSSRSSRSSSCKQPKTRRRRNKKKTGIQQEVPNIEKWYSTIPSNFVQLVGVAVSTNNTASTAYRAKENKKHKGNRRKKQVQKEKNRRRNIATVVSKKGTETRKRREEKMFWTQIMNKSNEYIYIYIYIWMEVIEWMNIFTDQMLLSSCCC